MASKIIKKPQRPERDASAVPAGSKVIEREVRTAKQQAQQILAEAEARARAILEEAEQAHARAVEEGYREGYEKGLAEWLTAIREVQVQMQHLVEQAKPELIRLAVRVAEKILRQQLADDPTRLLPMIDEAFRSLRAQKGATILLRVHPNDRSMLEAHRKRWLDRMPWIGELQVIADEEIRPGGCRIETDFGSVDLTLETQIRVIERHLLGGRE